MYNKSQVGLQPMTMVMREAETSDGGVLLKVLKALPVRNSALQQVSVSQNSTQMTLIGMC